VHALLQARPEPDQGELPDAEPKDTVPPELSSVPAKHDEQEFQKPAAQING
jgi:hypothetical protein